jgi:phosphoribosylanthranilate isomerase
VKTFVKFCGLTDVSAVELVPPGGAAGFVIQVPSSPRSLTPERAIPLIEKTPPEAEVWAVVVDPPEELVHQLFDEVGVDRVQIYGKIPSGLDFLELHHVVPSVPVPTDSAGAGSLPPIPPAEDFSRVHLDAAGPVPGGGSGVRPNWDVCARIVDTHPGRKFVLAGGLSAENVAEALRAVRPWGVDVSSGIEREPGNKDPERMRAFLRAVEAAEAEPNA